MPSPMSDRPNRYEVCSLAFSGIAVAAHRAVLRTFSVCARAAAILLALLGSDEPNGPLERLGWHHQLAQRIEDLLELNARVSAESVMGQFQPVRLHLKLLQPLRQIDVQARCLAQ